MIKGLGRVAISGIAAATLTVVGLAGAASAGMLGDATRTAGSTAGSEAVAAAQTVQTGLWYGRGTAELGAGQTAQSADRKANEVVVKAHEGSGQRPPQARPVRDALDHVSRTGAEVERVLVDTARSAAARVAEGSEAAATTLDAVEESVRR